MKRTLIDIVTEILSDMESDWVNSINDTEEAEAVARIVKSTYLAMASNRNWPSMSQILQLTPFTDNTRPTHTRIEDDFKELISVYYNKQKSGDNRKNYLPVRYQDPDSFLRLVYARNNTTSNIETVIDPSGVELLIQNDTAPQYYTSFNDTDLVFDSYDGSLDSTLQASKFVVRGYVIPNFELQDDFIPDLPSEAFPALVEEAKSKCFARLKQMPDAKSEQESTRQQRWLSRKSWRVHANEIYPDNYGRKARSGRYRDPTFRRD